MVARLSGSPARTTIADSRSDRRLAGPDRHRPPDRRQPAARGRRVTAGRPLRVPLLRFSWANDGSVCAFLAEREQCPRASFPENRSLSPASAVRREGDARRGDSGPTGPVNSSHAPIPGVCCLATQTIHEDLHEADALHRRGRAARRRRPDHHPPCPGPASQGAAGHRRQGRAAVRRQGRRRSRPTASSWCKGRRSWPSGRTSPSPPVPRSSTWATRRSRPASSTRTPT